ncbi:SigE family RNA polymerase sigma factor [Catellatospora sichuanensis]|uniref:SigE family RNA polymerase sigma factor n=1 Tax=Catellatospora sichuanensis TaxID=1969805 RepID=UPI00118296B5|nr:SigE family RNA polymerase sigma factor [Catellatospora sichuanensis]
MDRYAGFDEFVQARGAALSRTAFLLTGSHHLAEDLLQQALAKTAVHWPRVSKGGNPEGYVRRAMINERTSWWRRRKVIEVPAVDEALGREQGPDQAESVVRRLAVLHALATLAPRQRAAVVLRYFEDLTEPQIAEELGCSVGTVKSQLHDAMNRLRAVAPAMLAEGALK